MQTKNINLERAPTTTNNNSNNAGSAHHQLPALPQKLLQQGEEREFVIQDALQDAPPLPPRSTIIFTSLLTPSKHHGRTVRQVKNGERLRRIQSSLNHVSSPGKAPNCGDAAEDSSESVVDVDGYGPYKPVPPPKPVSHQSPQQSGGCLTPPPYRMPPYPLYNEPSIPGAAILDCSTLSSPIATSSPSVVGHQTLQTHSNKFPIEREVILSSTDKNSKIPILHDYMKRTKVAIAPDVPPKQMAAWTIQGSQTLGPDQNHSGHIQTPQQTTQDQNGPVYRAMYHAPQDYYNGQTPLSMGAVPRSSWHGDQKVPPRQYQQPEDVSSNTHSVTVQIEANSKDSTQKDATKNSKTMTKTYHTIKDMISGRFKSNKDSEEKADELGLNNSEELRKSSRHLDETEKKTAGEQGIYGKPRTDQNMTVQQHQYNQHIIQQHLISQQAMQVQQQYQAAQQYKSQQQNSHGLQQQHLTQARSQEMLAPKPEEQIYYQNTYGSAPQRPQNRYGIQQQQQQREQNYVAMTHSSFGNSKEPNKEERRLGPAEKRSAQQLERDSLRQKSFETRRAASHPQLAYGDQVKNESDNRPQPQTAHTPGRRGSYGNLIEATVGNGNDAEKDSDDGGFLKRTVSKEKRLDDAQEASTRPDAPQDPASDNCYKEDAKVTEALTGSPRKRLEGEIGKIEGVYNVGQRTKVENEDVRNIRKHNTGSGASSDYDKAGQSSSNADSGRGSAAYSSGRRPTGIDIASENCDAFQVQGTNYRELHSSSHDHEWVDIVETELRHILEPKLHELSLQGNGGVANSTLSESISSMTPPLPPLSPGDQSSPNITPRNSMRFKHSSLPYGMKPDYGQDAYGKSKNIIGSQNARWHPPSTQKHRNNKKFDHGSILRGKQIFGLDTTDLTSTTTRSLDLESILDGQSDSEGDISTTDARAIRKQLEGLETMYSEVLKLLGVKKHPGRYQPSDPRFCKRRYGSMSSLPSSSVSSRPIRDKRRASEDRKKVRDIRGINKRFQRLESHVVTLARSVAHLSSEMRTQHLMIQEMETIRGEISALRTQTNMLSVRSQSTSRTTNVSKDLPNLANPARVKKLTKFFGDEPPLLRLFLRKLGYEKYANVFENERIGMVELPYMSEERLQKMGVPLGPRLRIMQEAQISVCKDTTLCIV